MKRYKKVLLLLGTIGLLFLVYYGYLLYNEACESEPLTGSKDHIPSKTATLPPITNGAADWPNWRGTDFDGKSHTKGIKTDWSKGLKMLWKVNYLCQNNSTASWSAPVVQGNRLIVPGRDEKNDLVFCVNSETGELLWSGSYEANTSTSHGPGSRATPAISGNKVYTYGRGGDLLCWRLEDGKLLWKRNVQDEGGKEPFWGHSSSPLVIDNKVIVQGGGEALVIAYDKENGNLCWKSMKGDAGYATVIPMNIGNETQLLVYHGHGLSCLNSTDGKTLWTAPWETDYLINATTPIIDKDMIFHTSFETGCEALKVTRNGYSVLWKNQAFEAQHSDQVLIDGYIYGYYGESVRNVGQFKCVELSTGKEMWSTDKNGQGTITWVDGHLICLDLKGNLALIKPDPSGFNKVGEIKSAISDVKNPAWTVPVVANGRLYLRYMQQLVCYQLD